MTKLAGFNSFLKGTLFSVMLIVSLSLMNQTQAAIRFWIATGPASWNNGANWSAFSGGTGGAGVPGVNDVAFFDAAANGDCTINGAVNVSGILMSGYTGNLIQNNFAITVGASGYAQNTGTFTGSGAVITINNSGTFTLAGGTFISSSVNLTLSGTRASSQTLFSHSAGTFTHNNGLVTFNPALSGCASSTFTVDVIPATTFYNIILNGIANCGINAIITTATGDVVNASNDLTHTDGVITGAFAVKNNLIIGTGADLGTGTITVDGTGAQTYAVTGTPRTCSIIVNKASGTFAPAGGTTALSVLTFTLNAGTFTAPTGNLSVGGIQSTGTIFTHSGGTFTHNSGTTVFDPAVNGCVTGNFTIDVINSTRFNNVTLNGLSGCGNLANIFTAANDTIDAVNNFVHTDGVFNGLIQFKNNLTINAGADAGAGTIIADGTGAQTYSVAAGAPRTAHLIVNKTTGALTPAGGTTDLGLLKFTLMAGSFTAPSGNFSVGGAQSTATIFTHSGGTFTHNSGTTIFDPAVNGCVTGNFTIDVLTNTRFFNVTMNGASGCGNLANIFTAANDTIDAVNNFVHTDGVFNGTVQFKNNLTISSGADAGTGTVIADGTGAQTYSVASGSPRTAHLVVNKTSGALIPAGGTTDLGLLKFTLMSGSFTAPTGNFSIGGAQVTATIFTHSGGTFTHNNGTTVFDPTVNGCVTGNFTIDILNNTRFYNVTMNGASGCGNLANIYTAANDTLDAVNNFIHSDGVFHGFVQFKNNLTINAGADAGTGTIIADGTGAQTYSVASGIPRTAHLVVNKALGALAPAGGTTDLLLLKFTLMSGSFTAPSGNFNIGGSQATSTIFTHSGGTFIHNNGSTTFDPGVNGCVTGNFTIDILNSTRFYNVTINATPSCGNIATVYTAANDTIDAVNNFTHTDGIFNGYAQFKNNLTINAGADAGTGIIIADGTGAQTYTVASGSPRTAHLIVNKASGTLTPAGGTTDLYLMKFTLQSGSFTAPTGNFSIGGTQPTTTIFAHSGGTFTHNNGTTIFEPGVNGCVTGNFTIDILNNTRFYNITLNGTQSCGNLANIYTAASDTLDAINNLVHTDGVFHGYVQFKNNLTINSGADAGTGVIIADGTGAQTYTVASGSPRTAHLIVNKSAGALTPAGGTTDFALLKFTLMSGGFTAPSGNFNIGGAQNTSTIFTHIGGTFTHNNSTTIFDPAVNGCVTGNFTLDVLNSTRFYNITMSGTQNCGNLANIFTAASDTLDAVNNFVHTDGIFNGFVQFKNDLTINAGADGGVGTIIADGTGAQTYSVVAGSPRTAHLLVNKSSGALTPAGGTTDLGLQRFTLLAGSFTAPTGNFSIGGAQPTATIFTQSGGTFVHNSGTTIFDPGVNGCVTGSFTIDVITSTQFYNLTLNGTQNCGNIANFFTAASDTIDVANTLLYNDGRNNGTIEAGGNVTVSTNFDRGSGKLIFKGSAANQNFDLTGATNLVVGPNGTIVLNKTNATGTVTLLSALQLDAAGQSITFTRGRLVTTSTNILILGDNNTSPGSSVNSYVEGPLRKIGNDAYIFPTGKAGVYSPIAISAPANATNAFTGEYFLGNPNAQGYNTSLRASTLTDVSTCDYWILNWASGTPSVQVTLTWNQAAGCYGFNNPTILSVARWDGSQWADHGNTATTNNGTFGTVRSSTITSFSPIAIASHSTLLPVELVDFKATWTNKSVALDWITASELNNDFFTVERLEEGTFKPLTTVKGLGTSPSGKTYQYIDREPLAGQSYYRLKQTDFDGTFVYSDIVTVLNPFVEEEFNIHPNPAPIGSTITFSKAATVEVFNAMNQPVIPLQTVSKLENSGLLPGIYFIRTQKGTVVRLVIQ